MSVWQHSCDLSETARDFSGQNLASFQKQAVAVIRNGAVISHCQWCRYPHVCVRFVLYEIQVVAYKKAQPRIVTRIACSTPCPSKHGKLLNN